MTNSVAPVIMLVVLIVILLIGMVAMVKIIDRVASDLPTWAYLLVVAVIVSVPAFLIPVIIWPEETRNWLHDVFAD